MLEDLNLAKSCASETGQALGRRACSARGSWSVVPLALGGLKRKTEGEGADIEGENPPHPIWRLGEGHEEHLKVQSSSHKNKKKRLLRERGGKKGGGKHTSG